MGDYIELQLDFVAAHEQPVCRQPLRWSGFLVEEVGLQTDDAYAFHAQGDWHYLAFHDLTLLDGELQMDGLPRLQETNLRNTLTFAPKGCGIEGWAKPAPRKNAFTALYFDPAQLSVELGERYATLEPQPFAYARNPALAVTMQKLRALASAVSIDNLYAESLCLSATLEIFGVPRPHDGGRLSQRQLQRVYEFVEANLGKRISLDDLASLVDLSRTHFSRSFKATTGLGSHQFVRQLQLERACQLLERRPRLPIEAIALEVGFGSASVFRRAFQGKLGLSPLAYRREKC